MGASVSGYWPGITDEQRDSMPGFFNDDKAYGDWMANRVSYRTLVRSSVSTGAGEDQTPR